MLSDKTPLVRLVWHLVARNLGYVAGHMVHSRTGVAQVFRCDSLRIAYRVVIGLRVLVVHVVSTGSWSLFALAYVRTSTSAEAACSRISLNRRYVRLVGAGSRLPVVVLVVEFRPHRVSRSSQVVAVGVLARSRVCVVAQESGTSVLSLAITVRLKRTPFSGARVLIKASSVVLTRPWSSILASYEVAALACADFGALVA